ncbi:hypothetical protein Tsubulata_050637 [Turnera subulata]|uniref:Zinc finger PHD-type domain-containing protein n=1 Tax=Turnera subulata TaxID=218843 RepID=A0A9Q0JPI0_9ROSI|nr:hypothetical protein Tsubulata_050637 [Turnera subulata]
MIDASCFGSSQDHHQQVRTRVKHWSHKHGLKPVSNSAAGVEEEGPNDCSGCHETIQGPAYVCEKDGCGFMLDQSCFGLSKNHQLLHPLHPHHPLQLSDNTKQLQSQTQRISSDNVCDGCGYICGPFSFRCQEDCNFKLDVRCALSSEESHNSDDDQQPRTIINHFMDPHSLSLFNCRENDGVNCAICNDPIVGPTYGCFQCEIYLHVSCAEFQLQIQHPFHPQHPLRASATSQDQSTSVCKSCKWFLGAAVYQCRPCGFSLDMLCARQTRLSSPLKLDRLHQHNLYYTVGDKYEETDDGEDPDGGSDDVEDDPDGGSDDGEGEGPVEETDGEGENNKRIVLLFKKICNACNKKCVKSYYRCLECKYIIHLKCMGLPATVDHSCHFHPLTLVERFVEDDSGVYYCHACQQERNPDCPVYLCKDKECLDKAPFAAHIECIVSEVSPVFIPQFLL